MDTFKSMQNQGTIRGTSWGLADNPKTLKRQPTGSWKPVSAIGTERQSLGVDKLAMNKVDIVFNKVAKVLSTSDREHISKKNFAIPGKKNKSNPAGHGGYPIPDRGHARAALSMVSAHGSSSQKAEVRAKVHAKYPTMGKAAAMKHGKECPCSVCVKTFGTKKLK